MDLRKYVTDTVGTTLTDILEGTGKAGAGPQGTARLSSSPTYSRSKTCTSEWWYRASSTTSPTSALLWISASGKYRAHLAVGTNKFVKNPADVVSLGQGNGDGMDVDMGRGAGAVVDERGKQIASESLLFFPFTLLSGCGAQPCGLRFPYGRDERNKQYDI